MSEILRLDRVSRHFSGLQALRGVTLSLARGEVLGLIGPNGAGKTTLVNTVCGVTPASSGTITFDGAGNYTVSGTSVDNTVSSGAAQPLNVSGTYAIGSNGAGFIANPLYPTEVNDYVYGAVSQGVFAGSSTESEEDGNILNDIFIAIPVGAAPTNASSGVSCAPAMNRVAPSSASIAAASLDAVDLCTPSSRVTSVTPASPSRARISRMVTARSTDCTGPASSRPVARAPDASSVTPITRRARRQGSLHALPLWRLLGRTGECAPAGAAR